MADAFVKILTNAEKMGGESQADKTELMRELRPVQRQLLGLFAHSREVSSSEIAEYLGITQRLAREACGKWVAEGFLEIENASRKARSYRLAGRYEIGLM